MWKSIVLLLFVLTCSTDVCFGEIDSYKNRVLAEIGSEKITFHGIGHSGMKLVELTPYEEIDQATTKIPAWTSETNEKPDFNDSTLILSRYEGMRDRLFSRWVVLDAKTNTVIKGPSYPLNSTGYQIHTDNAIPKPASIKGVQCVVDHKDALALKTKQVAHNVDLKQLFDFSGKSDLSIEVDGEQIHFNPGAVKQLDEYVQGFSDVGVSVYLILLNYVPTNPDPNNPLIHPATNLKEAPNHLGAFNLTDRKGYLYYRAALEFLVRHYWGSGTNMPAPPSKDHGQITGLIIGNELQAHWWWYNMGDAEPEVVIANYERALRIAHQVVTKCNSRARIYTSMDHHWTASMVPNKKRFIPGKKFLTELNKLVKSQGDFEWHVAFHPYPENLFEPRTWNDQHAELHFETPKITFKNLEVLTEFLNQDEFIYSYEGQPRRVILSEQGFHAGEGEDGELVQAAAYAYAYYRASHLPGIDAFILHRHVDHAHEGGLKLGLRANKPGTISDLGPKRKIYEVFRQADRKNWQEAFEFAKPIIGIQNWSELNPQKVTGVRRVGSAVDETEQ